MLSSSAIQIRALIVIRFAFYLLKSLSCVLLYEFHYKYASSTRCFIFVWYFSIFAHFFSYGCLWISIIPFILTYLWNKTKSFREEVFSYNGDVHIFCTLPKKNWHILSVTEHYSVRRKIIKFSCCWGSALQNSMAGWFQIGSGWNLSKKASIGVGFSIWRHTFKMAAVTSSNSRSM